MLDPAAAALTGKNEMNTSKVNVSASSCSSVSELCDASHNIFLLENVFSAGRPR